MSVPTSCRMMAVLHLYLKPRVPVSICHRAKPGLACYTGSLSIFISSCLELAVAAASTSCCCKS